MSNKQDFRDTQQWKDAKAACLSAHNNTCKCCQSRKKLEVHHIEDASSNQDRVFDQSNLVPLCSECHPGYHQWMGGNDVPTSADTLARYMMRVKLESWIAAIVLVIGVFAATLWGLS